MLRDPIIDEVRRVRENEAAKYDFDVKRILAAAKRRQSRSEATLQQSEQDHLIERLGRSAHHRCDREAGQRHEEKIALAKA